MGKLFFKSFFFSLCIDISLTFLWSRESLSKSELVFAHLIFRLGFSACKERSPSWVLRPWACKSAGGPRWSVGTARIWRGTNHSRAPISHARLCIYLLSPFLFRSVFLLHSSLSMDHLALVIQSFCCFVVLACRCTWPQRPLISFPYIITFQPKLPLPTGALCFPEQIPKSEDLIDSPQPIDRLWPKSVQHPRVRRWATSSHLCWAREHMQHKVADLAPWLTNISGTSTVNWIVFIQLFPPFSES